MLCYQCNSADGRTDKEVDTQVCLARMFIMIQSVYIVSLEVTTRPLRESLYFHIYKTVSMDIMLITYSYDEKSYNIN